MTKPWSNTARRVISSPQLASNPGLAATAHPHSPTVHWMCHPLNFSHGGTTAAIRGHMISLHILMTDSTAACYLYPPSHLWIISDKWFQTVPLVTLAGPRLARSGNWVSPSFRPNVDDSDRGHERWEPSLVLPGGRIKFFKLSLEKTSWCRWMIYSLHTSKPFKTKYLASTTFDFVFKDNFLTRHLLFAYITELPSYFRNGTHIQMVFH